MMEPTYAMGTSGRTFAMALPGSIFPVVLAKRQAQWWSKTIGETTRVKRPPLTTRLTRTNALDDACAALAFGSLTYTTHGMDVDVAWQVNVYVSDPSTEIRVKVVRRFRHVVRVQEVCMYVAFFNPLFFSDFLFCCFFR
jgi:hypothetical protein